jgi:ligand-binding sensor domain-containing protein/signal transduction histidine kinase
MLDPENVPVVQLRPMQGRPPGCAPTPTRETLSSGAARRMLMAAVAAVSIIVVPARTVMALDPRSALTDYSLTTWSEESGPFPFGIYAIAQDEEGYLWLGARTGLIRFDGTTFKKWSGSAPLPDDRVSAIRVARDGAMWLGFGTVGGVTRIFRGQVTNFSPRDGLTVGDVNELIEDQDGVIWAATYGGLSRFVQGHWETVSGADGLPAEAVYSVLNDSAGNLWVGTTLGVYRRAAGEQKFELNTAAVALGFAEDASGTIWRSDREKGVVVLSAGHEARLSSTARRSSPGRYVVYDQSGSLWVSGRGSGVWRFKYPTAGAEPSVERLSRREGLLSTEIRCLFEDRHGTLWIGSRTGLTRLQESNVHAMLTNEDVLISAVQGGNDGSVWIATSNGLRRRQGGSERLYGTADGLPSESVTALHKDASGTIWVATGQGIARLVGDRFVPISVPDRQPLRSVRSLASDHLGVLWICDQQRGLFQWKDGKLTEVDETLTEQGGAHVVYADAADRVWVGLWTTGIAVFDKGKLDFYTVQHGLPSGTVNDVYQDRSGSIWVATTGGLARFDDGRFTTFTKHGFPDFGISSILEDVQGYLWFGSRNGLLRISPAEFEGLSGNPNARLRYTFYGTEEGIPGTLSRPAMPNSTRQSDGTLWFVTSVGLAIVDPTKLHDHSPSAPARIEDVIADGSPVSVTAGLELPPRPSRIQINYSILSLAAVGKVRFRYKLENFESDWEDAGERRQASYTNLPPGSYRFRVVASNSKGDWSEDGDVLAFSIMPAFYQTRTFDALVVAALGLVTWGMWQFRLRSIQRRFDLVLAERMRMGREIHDTLLQSLVGVALEFDDIWEQLDPSAVALRAQVQRIREQVEHYAREARRSIWNLRSPMLESHNLPAALRRFGEAAVAGTEIEFGLSVIGTPRRAESRVEQELLRVGQEALSNAVRHSGARQIIVEVSYHVNSVRLQVSDDGRGFDLSQVERDRSGHWGVSSMRERAQHIGARFAIVTSSGHGTSIEMIAGLMSVPEGA